MIVDPGNLNQTRTPSNGLLSGMVIDLLETLAVDLDVSIKYYYPCKISTYESNGICEKASSSDALNWLAKGDTDSTTSKVQI